MSKENFTDMIKYFSLVLLVFIASRSFAQDNPLMGAWEVESIHWISSDTTVSIEEAQAGIFMVTESRYSIIWTPTRTPRVPFAVLSSPTDEEAIAGFKSIVFNSGTYTIGDSTFDIEAEIAKVPGFEGGQQNFTYKIDGDQLSLRMRDETYPDGSKPEWSGKWETLFVMKRID